MAFYNSEFDGTNGMDIARARIAWEAEHRTGELDLTQLDLEEVPQELAALSHLRKLRLEGRPKRVPGSKASRFRHFNFQIISKNHNLRHLSIRRFSLQDLSWLQDFPELLSLEIRRSLVQNLTGLENCDKLQLLNCSLTKINNLQGLKNCVNLQELRCAHTNVNNLTGLENCTKLQKLDCRRTTISSLAELKNNINLKELNCSFTQINSLFGLENCTELQKLDCIGTNISSLAELKNCINLQELDCRRTKIIDLTELKNCINLQELDCSFTQISSLAGLENCINLQKLDCRRTKISNLTELKNCINLQKLDCGRTKISNLIELKNCISLQEINCSSTQINSLIWLNNCINMQEIHCSYTRISSLAGLENYTNLKKLNCDRTKISNLTALKNCTNLQDINCCHTKISELTELKNCTKLQELDCSSTQISSLAGLENCTDLLKLNCSNTDIRSVDQLGLFLNLRKLDCSHTSMLRKEGAFERLANLPLEILIIRVSPQTDKIDSALLSQNWGDNCLPALRAHFADLRLEAQDQRDFKILVLGNGRSGKTQLVRRLCGDNFVEDWDSTHGIQLAQAKLPDRDDGGENRLHLWDFGGQELYHGTHALFLRQASAVIVNWAADTEQAPEQIDPHGLRFRNHPLGYWLSLLDNLVPAELPRLLIRSKSDQPDQITPIYPAGHDALTEIRFSAKTQHGLGQVRGALQDAIATSRQQHRYKIGAGRQKLINKLMALAQQPGGFAADQKIIDRATFRRWCQDIGQISDAEQCLIYLDRIGMLIYRPRQLGDRIILDQSWALNGIYTLFQRDKAYRYLRQQNGRFTAQDLVDQVWQQDFTAGEQELFIDLMLASGICFRISPGRYLAPDLLPDRNRVADDIDARWVGDTPAICQTVSYRFRHPGILRRLIGAIGRYTKLHALYWQTGLCAYDGRRQSRLLIEDIPDPAGWGCQLVLKAKDGQATDLLAWVLKQLDHIHQELGLHPEAPLPVPSETPELAPPTGSSSDYRWYVSYAWGDDSPEGLERKKVIEQLMADAQARNIAIRRDREQLTFGDDIRAFMDTLVTGQRIFILLSDKYLRSPFCTYELYHIWRECRQNADEFSSKVRIYQTPCARIADPHERAIYYQHWKTEVARLGETIALYDPADIPKLDQQMLHAINGFKGQIGDILAEIANRLQPRPWEDFIAHGFT